MAASWWRAATVIGWKALTPRMKQHLGACRLVLPRIWLRRWKQQGELERRFSDWKGPLLVHPVFLKTPQRIAALILLLHLALMIFCLIERAVRAVPQGVHGCHCLLANSAERPGPDPLTPGPLAGGG